MSGREDGVGLTLTALGALFIYGGIKGYSIMGIVGNMVKGQPPFTGIAMSQPLSNASTDTGTGAMGSVTPAPGTNQQLGQQLAAGYGWNTGTQWNDLVLLWNRESGWSNTAQNPSSGAYGIPQALPYTKMPKVAWPSNAGGSSDPTAQIQWGLSYIQSRYGSPSAAWAHETSNGWY